MQYFIIANDTVETDPKTGYPYVLVKMTNPGVREIQTRQNDYVENEKDRYNSRDASKRRQMEVSKDIRDEIHTIWVKLNPS